MTCPCCFINLWVEILDVIHLVIYICLAKWCSKQQASSLATLWILAVTFLQILNKRRNYFYHPETCHSTPITFQKGPGIGRNALLCQETWKGLLENTPCSVKKLEKQEWGHSHLISQSSKTNHNRVHPTRSNIEKTKGIHLKLTITRYHHEGIPKPC